MTKLRNVLSSATFLGCVSGLATAAHAQEKYVGEMFITAATYCPAGSMEARGQTLSISSNQVLFALLGTTYGGDGVSTFKLPDMSGRVPVGVGLGAGLTQVNAGDVGGAEAVALLGTQLPMHQHMLTTVGVDVALRDDFSGIGYATVQSVEQQGDSVTLTGTNSTSGAPVSVRDPYIALRYCVVETGLWPPRD